MHDRALSIQDTAWDGRPVRIIELNRPKRGNCLSVALLRALCAAVREAAGSGIEAVRRELEVRLQAATTPEATARLMTRLQGRYG